MADAAWQRTGGYLTSWQAMARCRGRVVVLDALQTPVLDRPPLLHRPGDTCWCLDSAWVDGYAYRLHDFRIRYGRCPG
jgi:hypothetical protein